MRDASAAGLILPWVAIENEESCVASSEGTFAMLFLTSFGILGKFSFLELAIVYRESSLSGVTPF